MSINKTDRHIRITVGDRPVVVLRTPEQSPQLSALTDAERAVAVLVARGLSNLQIAQRRGRSPRTVANQVRSVYTKLEIESRQQLARQCIKALDRARARLHRGNDEGLLSLWRGLVQGRWSVFDQVDTDGKHFIVVHENDPDAAGPKRLTRRETQVATYAAQGHTNKTIAYELGIARTTVATHLTTALSKLGLRRRTDLVWLYGHLSGSG